MTDRGALAWPTAHSPVVGVVGYPVAHSLSPLLHHSAFGLLGLDWVSVGFAVEPDRLGEAIAGVRGLGLRGVSVTMPHKARAAELVDRLSSAAAALGALNCIAHEGGELVGHNTDGEGFLAALRRGACFEPAPRRCAVIGAGGAGRAVVAALAAAGAAEVVVVARSPVAGGRAAALAGAVGRQGAMVDVQAADLVVDATPVGMTGTPAAGTSPVVDPELLHSGQVVVDLVYDPQVTPLLAAAGARGATTLGGLGMLVHQAAAQVRLWTGLDAPVDAMWAAAQSTLACPGDHASPGDHAAKGTDAPGPSDRRHGDGVAGQ